MISLFFMSICLTILNTSINAECDPEFEVPAITERKSTQKSIVDFHNIERSFYKSPDLTWSDNLAEEAKTFLNTGCEFKDYESPYGENIFEISDTNSSDPMELYKDAIDEWKFEFTFIEGMCMKNARTLGCPWLEYYDGFYQYEGENRPWNHYTQMVWQNTKEIGCALYQKPNKEDKIQTIILCLYNPQGNILGQAITGPEVTPVEEASPEEIAEIAAAAAKDAMAAADAAVAAAEDAVAAADAAKAAAEEETTTAATTTIATPEEITTTASSAINFPEANEETPEEIAAAAAKDAVAAADAAKAAAEKATASADLAAAAASGSK